MLITSFGTCVNNYAHSKAFDGALKLAMMWKRPRFFALLPVVPDVR